MHTSKTFYSDCKIVGFIQIPEEVIKRHVMAVEKKERKSKPLTFTLAAAMHKVYKEKYSRL